MKKIFLILLFFFSSVYFVFANGTGYTNDDIDNKINEVKNEINTLSGVVNSLTGSFILKNDLSFLSGSLGSNIELEGFSKNSTNEIGTGIINIAFVRDGNLYINTENLYKLFINLVLSLLFILFVWRLFVWLKK